MRALRMSAYVRVHIRVSTLVYVHVQVCTLYASAFVVVQKIKCSDASKHKWISASGCIFCSRTFGMHHTQYICTYVC